jgi:aspartate/methionine/tyrosine aminotransferase
VLILNAPNNPTGWTLTRREQQALLDHCRRTGTWILADEVYERLYYRGRNGQWLRAEFPGHRCRARPAGGGAQLSPRASS